MARDGFEGNDAWETADSAVSVMEADPALERFFEDMGLDSVREAVERLRKEAVDA